MSVPPAASEAAETPARPFGVPAAATWQPDAGVWELAPRDADGRREGVALAWRADGTLASETTFRADERDGAFRRFHEDGSVAREGLYRSGRQHGLMRAHGSDAPTSEPMQACCVPENAWRLEHDYDDGHLADVRWYDRAGVHILPSGKPHPLRPEGVPKTARYEEGRDLWVESSYSDGAQAEGVWLRWARDGVLRERDEYVAGRAHGLWQRFDEAGALGEESEWRDAQRSGAHRRVGAGADVYTDARVVEERGRFEREQTIGRWTLHDAAGAVLATFELGAALDEATLLASPAFEPDARDWAAASDELARAGRPAEALLAAARAAAAARDAAPLRAALARLALPRRADNALALANEIVSRADGGLAVLANGLVAGGDAASLLRALASALTGRDVAALALVDAALLLSPDLAACHVTRALVNVHLGRPDDARADAAALPEDLAEQRAFLESYVRVIFTEFPFWPSRTEIVTQFPDVPEAPEQSIDAIIANVQKYATRLGQLRAAIAARLPAGATPAWLPPDLSALLPRGPAPLVAWEFEEVVEPDEDEAAAEGTEDLEPMHVTVDEALKLDPDAPLPSLMRLARREWAGLCWLCWSAGLDRVALPRDLVPPAQFGLAAGMAIERLWRCRDKIITGGLRALTQGVPGFVWEGIEIDLAPAVLAEIAADEHLEMRAVFYWLCDAGVQSPWQDNLRNPD
jgi:hypothetical protein